MKDRTHGRWFCTLFDPFTTWSVRVTSLDGGGETLFTVVVAISLSEERYSEESLLLESVKNEVVLYFHFSFEIFNSMVCP